MVKHTYWRKENSDLPTPYQHSRALIAGNSMNEFAKYWPSPSWFAHNPYGIHGMGHAARVLVWADLIGRRLQANAIPLSLEAVRWAAVLHDVGRLSDGWDSGYGARSADWVLQNRDSLPFTLPDDLFERVLLCCRPHETSDQTYRS